MLNTFLKMSDFEGCLLYIRALQDTFFSASFWDQVDCIDAKFYQLNVKNIFLSFYTLCICLFPFSLYAFFFLFSRPLSSFSVSPLFIYSPVSSSFFLHLMYASFFPLSSTILPSVQTACLPSSSSNCISQLLLFLCIPSAVQ